MGNWKERSPGSPGRYDPRRLLLHYALTISLVIGLLVHGTMESGQALEQATRGAESTELVGHQRMLSQRILYLASQYHIKGSSIDKNFLRSEIALFEAFHRQIAVLAAAIADREDRFGEDFDARALGFAGLARAVANAPARDKSGAEAMRDLRRAGMSVILADLDAVSAAFAAEARETHDVQRRRDRFVFYLVLGLLVAEGILVFWPAHRAAIASLGTLETRNSAIRKEHAALEDHARQLEISVYHDPLTGLNNRTRLYEYLNGLLVEERPARAICVLHVDLDHFKELNDSLGHAMGDAALKHVAGIMTARVRRDDLVARVGGDEFVIVMQMRQDRAAEIAEDICARLIKEVREPMVVNGADIQLGASVGYAFASAETHDADALIANADIALYEAKRAGKGVARPFTDLMQAQVTRRKTMAGDMERGLETGAFVPYFQPLVSLSTDAVERIEMLARWVHPDRGLIHPPEFMPVAEEIGIVDAIESRIFLDGLDMLGALRQEGRTLPQLAINASSRTMRYEDYAELLTDAVRARGFEPPDIIIEVLETSLVADTRDQTAETVSKLRALGYSVHVDDFGTGYSSLLNLASLDVNGLKIDRSLIEDIEGPRTRQIVQAIIGLARAMSMTVSADGVESDAQSEELRWLGADTAQGSAIAPAMPPDVRAYWLARPTEHSGAPPQPKPIAPTA